LPSAVALPNGMTNHWFLSHFQATGGDQTNALSLELEKLGFKVRAATDTAEPYPLLPVPHKCWYDNRADDLTKEGMRAGIESAGCFLLFLSAGVLSRPFVQVNLGRFMYGNLGASHARASDSSKSGRPWRSRRRSSWYTKPIPGERVATAPNDGLTCIVPFMPLYQPDHQARHV
jgi:hypothetical protein